MAPKIDERTKRQALNRAREEFGNDWSKPKALGPAFEALTSKPTELVYSMDPWFLARYEPQLEKTAIDSLNREGFECWYPTYRDVRPLPLRLIPPKKRDQAHLYMRETRKPRFVGYILIRRKFGNFDVNRLFDLKGCGSVVTVGGCIAKIRDYDVELMRLAESDGRFDHQMTRGSAKPYRLTKSADDGRDQWVGQSRALGRLDESGKTSLFVDAYGRVAHIIAGADQHPDGE